MSADANAEEVRLTTGAARLVRERRTIATMIAAYCRGAHASRGRTCAECGELLAYASRKLDRCPFGEDKPQCTQCPIHCYQPRQREQVKAVMRWAGPRLVFRHPYLALRHRLDGIKKAPLRPRRAAAHGSQ